MPRDRDDRATARRPGRPADPLLRCSRGHEEPDYDHRLRAYLDDDPAPRVVLVPVELDDSPFAGEPLRARALVEDLAARGFDADEIAKVTRLDAARVAAAHGEEP